jgi:RNA polymerase sigma-70 factor (ECF subfamily)
VTDIECELIQLAQEKDTSAFCVLAESYTQRIYLLAYHYCRNAQDAEDLSQEVWLRAYQSLNTFRFESSFYTWLRRITINTFINYRRSKLSWRNDSLDESCSPLDLELEESIYNQVLFTTVMSALDELTPSQRLIFLLRHYEGMSYEEIAELMKCSTGTAKKSVWRVLTKLRTKLAVRNEEPDEGVRRLIAQC